MSEPQGTGRLKAERSYALNCRNCGTFADIYDCRTYREAERTAREMGWKLRRGYWFCGGCTTSPEGEA